MTRWSLSVSRREFVRTSAFGIAAIGAGRPFPVLAARIQSALSLGVIAPAGEAADGIALGIREAQHAAGLFGRQITEAPLTDAAGWPEIQALVFAGDPADAAKVAVECTRGGILFLNAVAPDDQLRRTGCTRMTFHVTASESMRRTAADSAGKSGADVEVELWHPSLERFGAGQLNDRYRATGKEMSSRAWAGWMAVKVAWETFLRASEPSGRAMAAHLERDSTHFDGHKGAPLSFRSWDHQLRQPLYVVSGEGNSVSEVPSLSRSDVPMRELLDTIGDREGQTRCE